MTRNCLKRNCLNCFIGSGELRYALERSNVSQELIEKIITRLR